MTESNEVNFMYLPKNFWSPRYESNFFTLKIEGKYLVNEWDDLKQRNTSTERDYNGTSPFGGKSTLPAYYYDIVVYRQHQQQSMLRRYSEFRWLHGELQAYLAAQDPSQRKHASDTTPLQFPPGTCPFLHWQNDEFAQHRLEQLSEYMNDALSRPGVAKHPAVRQFLEL